jgi:UDP-glucose:(heptosyl)LPS alpha-1,3-glucosyltransferase
LKPLLHALAERRRREPGARPLRLVVCGGGSLGPFERMARRLGVAGDVRFLGFYPDIRACYWSCDFLVAPTYYDPCSLVVFEALACGLPVITTACNGAGELMTEGRDGFVISSPDAVEELLAAFGHMARDAERAAMSVHAARLGREQSMERHVGRMVRVFEEVAASRRRRGPRLGRPVAKGMPTRFPS